MGVQSHPCYAGSMMTSRHGTTEGWGSLRSVLFIGLLLPACTMLNLGKESVSDTTDTSAGGGDGNGSGGGNSGGGGSGGNGGSGGDGGGNGGNGGSGGNGSGSGNNDGPDNNSPTRPADIHVVTGYQHSCVWIKNGYAKCWGGNDYGELGIGSDETFGYARKTMGDELELTDMGTIDGELPLKFKKIVSSFRHNCATFKSGGVKCWGGNQAGQLGLGHTLDRGKKAVENGDYIPYVQLGTGLLVKDIAVGGTQSAWETGHDSMSCALLTDGDVKCWGGNDVGQLGTGDTLNRGDEPDEMGNNLTTVNLGTGRIAKRVAVGEGHACAILGNNELKCWGDNRYGQLGNGDIESRGDEPNEMGYALPAVDLGTGRYATDLTLGYYTSCALLDNNQVKCWGRNTFGSCGLEDSDHRGDELDEMGDELPQVFLGVDRTVKAIAGGRYHTCAVLDTDQIKCWGHGGEGCLGNGSSMPVGNQEEQMGDFLPLVELGSDRTVAKMVSGYRHSCAILDNAQVKCWGWNHGGQLGIDDIKNRGDGLGEMGDELLPVDLGNWP